MKNNFKDKSFNQKMDDDEYVPIKGIEYCERLKAEMNESLLT